MPALSYPTGDFVPFTKIQSSDVNGKFDAISTLLNTTKLDYLNIQDGGVRGVNLNANVVDDASLALSSNQLIIKDSGVTTAKINDSAVTLPKLSGTIFPGPSKINIGLEAAQTSVAADSIKVTSSSGSDLSSSNVGRVILSGATAGQLASFDVSADVTIDLTGAHWGLGTHGDQTDYILSVYAINDAGTLKWGVSPIPGLRSISGSNDETTATNVTTLNKVLVNSALTGDSPCLEIGYFKANFDDTGGSSEDLWTVQTGLGDIKMESAMGKWHPFYMTIGGTTSAPTRGTISYELTLWRRVDDVLEIKHELRQTSAGSIGSGAYLFDFSVLGLNLWTSADNGPVRVVGNTTALIGNTEALNVSQIGYGHFTNSSGAFYDAALFPSTSQVFQAVTKDGDVGASHGSATVPMNSTNLVHSFTLIAPCKEFSQE